MGAPCRLLLWMSLITQLIFLTLCDDDTGFAIEDESCDGSCKAPGRAETEAKQSQSAPKKKSAEQRQQEVQQDVMQYQNYLKYMEEEGNTDGRLSLNCWSRRRS